MTPFPDDDPRSPYLQVADALRRSIRSGEFTSGTRIPSIDTLAAQFGVARNTVRSALRELTNEGLVISRQGSGVFVRSNLPDPATTGSDSSRLDAVVQELTDVREEVRTLRQRVAHLESLTEDRVSPDA
ncbi:MAG: hypothetical protein QG597_3152 [Actinomycetota bacterium]|nr:hypothetical protein [Actinomycetota bacterium]